VKNFAKQLKSQRKKQTNNLQQLLFQAIWIIPRNACSKQERKQMKL